MRIIIHGCRGRMGRILTECINNSEDMEIVAGIDGMAGEDIGSQSAAFPEYKTPDECSVSADVIIDFSHHSAVPAIAEYAAKHSIPLVVATTALTEDESAAVTEAAGRTPVFSSPNMSLGISLMRECLKTVIPALEKDFNIEIVEKHHNRKKDSPSGTALLLADTVNETCRQPKEYIFGRHGSGDECKINQMGIHAVRGGTISGEHTVIFAGPDEILEIKHTALSAEIFARGAIMAADYIKDKTPGMYSMPDMLKGEI